LQNQLNKIYDDGIVTKDEMFYKLTIKYFFDLTDKQFLKIRERCLIPINMKLAEEDALKEKPIEYYEEFNISEFERNNNEEFDHLFAEAARIVVNQQLCSTSFLQRKLKLGYNRIGRIVDQLEREKIIGSSNGSKPRDVLMTKEELDIHLIKIGLSNEMPETHENEEIHRENETEENCKIEEIAEFQENSETQEHKINEANNTQKSNSNFLIICWSVFIFVFPIMIFFYGDDDIKRISYIPIVIYCFVMIIIFLFKKIRSKSKAEFEYAEFEYAEEEEGEE